MCLAYSRTHWAGLTCSLHQTHTRSPGPLGLLGQALRAWPHTTPPQTVVAFSVEGLWVLMVEGKLQVGPRLVGLGQALVGMEDFWVGLELWWVGQVGEGWAHLQVVVLGWVSKWVQMMKGRRKMKEYLVEVGFGKMVDLHS